jgi:hypothetical protein
MCNGNVKCSGTLQGLREGILHKLGLSGLL